MSRSLIQAYTITHARESAQRLVGDAGFADSFALGVRDRVEGHEARWQTIGRAETNAC